MVIYLDPEEEITGAVARIRAADGDAVVLVMPPGSRIATSRINFRLLEREAQEKGLDLVCVSDEPGVRALAISAGVPAYDSVAHAEAGIEEFARQDERLAARTGAPPRRAAGDDTPSAPAPISAERPTVPPPAAPARRGRRRTGEGDGDDEALAVAVAGTGAGRRRRRRSRIGPLLAVVLAVALIGVAAYGAYVLVPTASITLRPALTPVGPVTTEVLADPLVGVVDPGEGVIPAQPIRVPLAVEGQFAATGTQVTTTRATGSVRFRSTNTVSEIVVPAGTRLATGDGLAFQTTEAVTVPRAVFDTGTPGTADAGVRAVRAGPRGNIAAGRITVVPNALAEQQLSVTNPQPTTGGGRLQQSVVTRADYDAAAESLEQQLEQELAGALADPALTPVGLTLYPASARIGERVPSQPPDSVVGAVADAFELELAAEATVLAVDETLVDQVAVEQLRALVPAAAHLLEGSIEVSHAPGEAVGDRIRFAASADGSAYRQPEREPLLQEVRGKTVAEARAIMETYGSVEISVWPEFVDRVPDQPSRINLTIVPPTESP